MELLFVAQIEGPNTQIELSLSHPLSSSRSLLLIPVDVQLAMDPPPDGNALPAFGPSGLRSILLVCLFREAKREGNRGMGDAWALKVAAVLQINTQQSKKIGVSNEGGVREDARLRRNT